VAEAVAAGVDLISFSGDKLLGGPQGGIVVGRRELIDRLAADPLARAVRCDKMTLAALEVLLRVYLEADGWRRIPTLAMLATPVATLAGRARRLATRIRRAAPMLAVSCRRVDSRVGGGAQAEVALPSAAVALSHPDHSAADLEEWLRTGKIPVIGRIEGGELLLDCRCLLPGDGRVVCDRLSALVAGGSDRGS
jgi:L-seryl-tRNA(Ser) seleniumtransferase